MGMSVTQVPTQAPQKMQAVNGTEQLGGPPKVGGGGPLDTSSIPPGPGQAIEGTAEVMPQLVAVLQQLVQTINALIAALTAQISGGGGIAPPAAPAAPAGDAGLPPAAPAAAAAAAPAAPAAVATPQVATTPKTPVSYSVSTPGGSKWTAKVAEFDQIKALPGVQMKANY